MNPFTKRTIDIIQSIPEGRIMTYGQIASLAGNSRGARQVVRVLHSMSHSSMIFHGIESSMQRVKSRLKMMNLILFRSLC